MNIAKWRWMAGLVALVIGVYLAGSWLPLSGVAVGDVVAMCEQPYMGWHIWHFCPDRAPRTTELAGAGLGLAAAVWVAWIVLRRIYRAFARRGARPYASE